MGAMKNKLIEFEETFHDELVEKFCKKYEQQWQDFLEEECNNYLVGNE